MNTAELLDIRYHLGFFKRSAPKSTFYTLFFLVGGVFDYFVLFCCNSISLSV